MASEYLFGHFTNRAKPHLLTKGNSLPEICRIQLIQLASRRHHILMLAVLVCVYYWRVQPNYVIFTVLSPPTVHFGAVEQTLLAHVYPVTVEDGPEHLTIKRIISLAITQLEAFSLGPER